MARHEKASCGTMRSDGAVFYPPPELDENVTILRSTIASVRRSAAVHFRPRASRATGLALPDLRLTCPSGWIGGKGLPEIESAQ